MNTAEHIESAPVPGGVPGNALREAREAQNLTVADVARQLKLSLNQVEALEAGEFGRLPGQVFVRGFVRNYARLLNLDAAPLVSAVASQLPHEELPPPAPPSQEIPFPTASQRSWRAYAFGLAVIIALLAVYEFMLGGSGTTGGQPAPVTPPPAASALTELPGRQDQPALAAGQAAPGPGDATALAQPDSTAATGASVAGAEAGSAKTAAGQEDAAPDARAATRGDGAMAVPVERTVHLVFEEESWVEIHDGSGERIFSQLNRAGTEKRVSGRPPLAIVVGNARGVRMTYDERPVNLSDHMKVGVARLTLE